MQPSKKAKPLRLASKARLARKHKIYAILLTKQRTTVLAKGAKYARMHTAWSLKALSIVLPWTVNPTGCMRVG